MNLSEKLIFKISETTSSIGVESSIKSRIKTLEDQIDRRSKMSPEAKSEQSWKDKDKEYQEELKVLKSMLNSYKKFTDL